MLSRGTAAILLKAAATASFLALTWWLLVGHAPGEVVLRLTLHCTLGIALPGLILWRLATPRRHNLLEDVAAGFLVGASCLLLVYLVCGALGLQRWAGTWAVPVVLAALLVPKLRRRCLRRVTESLSATASWTTAIALAVPMYALGRYRDGLAPAPYSDARWHSPDMAFHHALAASAKFDFPLQASWVDGEPMSYHYFYHQLIAAISWSTGIDLTDLVYTIGWAPIFLAGTALLVPLANRIAPRSVWVGPLAVLASSMGGALQPYTWVNLTTEQTTSYVWSSPTQNLGGALTVLLALIAVDLLRGDRNRITWVAFCMVALAAAGSKATVLPVVVCGFLLAGFVRLLTRRLHWAALVGAAISAVLFALVVATVFAGQSSGLAIRPWRVFFRLPFYRLVNVIEYPELDTRAMWVTGVVICLAWTLAGAGLLVALVPTRRWAEDPAVPFLVGLSVSGFVAMLITDQSGNSQLYFHRTAVPVTAVLACYGVWLVTRRLHDRRAAALIAVAVIAGLGAAAAARAIVKARTVPGAGFRTPDGRLAGLVDPWLWTVGLLLAAAVLVTLVWKLARRSGHVLAVLAAACLAVGTGAGLLVPLQAIQHTAKIEPGPPGLRQPLGPRPTAAEAARWLRANSDPDDLVATNAHCVIKVGQVCDSRHFWIAALTERHVLVEGWGYTNKINEQVAATGENPFRLPFWDLQRLEDNDAAFRARPKSLNELQRPPKELRNAVNKLRDEYGVRWLFADLTYAEVPHELAEVADLRYDGLDVQIFEIRR
ncbi:MAG: hypothetical protein ACRDP9_28000 [Kribbellaceae bacterium]